MNVPRISKKGSGVPEPFRDFHSVLIYKLNEKLYNFSLNLMAYNLPITIPKNANKMPNV
jgi:hypothetical protein